MTDISNPTNEPKKIAVKKTARKAPSRVVEIDDTRHDHQVLQGRASHFQVDCPACIKETRNRATLSVDELENAVFLYPVVPRYETLALEWLRTNYPGMDLNHGSAVPIWQLASAEECSIICIRPIADLGKALEPAEVAGLDAFKKITLIANDKEKQLAQMCASEPLHIRELCHRSEQQAGRIQVAGLWDASELIKCIIENFPGFRVHVPDQKNWNEDLVVGPK